ncbi:hypothetical protein C8R44DRAFT_739847 [Mycena epipterygia]|nr:hypothetical protein C8R44DRAFT_739847 [Mycena epipterygia]
MLFNIALPLIACLAGSIVTAPHRMDASLIGFREVDIRSDDDLEHRSDLVSDYTRLYPTGSTMPVVAGLIGDSQRSRDQPVMTSQSGNPVMTVWAQAKQLTLVHSILRDQGWLQLRGELLSKYGMPVVLVYLDYSKQKAGTRGLRDCLDIEICWADLLKGHEVEFGQEYWCIWHVHEVEAN